MNHQAPVTRRISRFPVVNDRKALLVLGMHRSGTSALTRVLGLCGAALPTQDSYNVHSSNPLGHWEPRRIVQAHDRFLNAVGAAWDASYGYPDSIFDTEAAVDCQHSLTELARSEFGQSRLFVLKDPRISRLLRLWRPVLADLGAAPYAAIMIRNPLEIAASLSSRDGWDEHRAVLVTIQHLLAAERSTRDLPRCFIRYGDLIEDWRTVVSYLSDRLGVALPPRDRATDAEIDAFVRSDLRHHRRTTVEFLGRSDIPDCLKQAFEAFVDATASGRIDSAKLDTIAADIADAEAIFKCIRRRAEGGAVRSISTATIEPSKRDALLAVLMAEYGRADDTARNSKRVLDKVMATRSWRFTRGFRVLGRAFTRLASACAQLTSAWAKP